MITPIAMTELFLNDIENVTARLTYEQEELATGRRVTSPSIDPAAAGTDIALTASLDANAVYRSNSQDALSWLNETDSTLQSVSSYLSRAYQLAIEAANGSLSQTDLQAIAAEVQSLVNATQEVEASQFEGLPLFGGTSGAAYGTAAFTAATNQPFRLRIGSTLTLAVSVTDYQAFQATGVDPSLQKLESDLSSGNTSAFAADAQAIQTAQAKLLGVIAGVAANTSLTESQQSFLQNEQVSLLTAQQETVGADAAQVATAYGRDQSIYQDALAAAAKVLQPSLLNYLT